LAGARSWRSVGMQYVGAIHGTDVKVSRQLFARAVEEDAENRLALVSYWNVLYRK
jgi:hypothetical protein